VIPVDLDIWRFLAIALIFGMWAGYGPVLSLLGHGSLNSQLHVVRMKWMRNVINAHRENRVFDGILLGHIAGQMSFFGSATLIVLAGLVGTLTGIGSLHTHLNELPMFPHTSLGLFTVHFVVLTVVMAFTFFSFTYSLRKLAYTLAMIGGLPEQPCNDPEAQVMIDQTAMVLTDSVKSLNNGIRGFYFAVAALFLFAGPLVSIIVTLAVSVLLYWRQGLSTTALAIERFVDAMNKRNH
jgi:uncharacterized membrane protein